MKNETWQPHEREEDGESVARRAVLSRRQLLAAGLGLGVATATATLPVRVLAANRPLRDFGVRADGAADDTAALQRALEASKGGTLELPAGRYRLGGAGLVVPSGTRLIGRGQAILIAPEPGPYAAIQVPPGSREVEIAGIEVRGPWAGAPFPSVSDDQERSKVWRAQMAENIGIHVQGVWHLREIAKALKPGDPRPAESTGVNIHDCVVTGFGQSAVLADNVSGFEFRNNRLSRCGRDGLRMYGVVDGKVEKNQVSDLLFGFGGNAPFYNVYGITATRVYGNARFPDPELQLGRPSRRVLIADNVVRNAFTWKSLDTHGGVEIDFLRNNTSGSHIGIGIDHGGWDEKWGFAPPRAIRIEGNTISAAGASVPLRAGITGYAHNVDPRNIGRDLVIEHNVIKGYGGEKTDGGISISNFSNVQIVANEIQDSLRAGICLDNRVEHVRVHSNRIRGVRKTSYGAAYGILVQTSDTNGEICGNTIEQPNSQSALSAHVSLESAKVRGTVNICSDNLYGGRSQAAVRAPR